MRKKSKWLKWQIGGGITLALSLVLNIIRSDPSFVMAQEKNRSGNLMVQQMSGSSDPVWEEFRQESHRRNMETGSNRSHSVPTEGRKMQDGRGHTKTRWS